MPTSITTWFLETCSLPIKFGLPAATIRISADLVCFAKSLVWRWQTVTVASRFKNARNVGLPTRKDRPTTTTCLPTIGILYSSRSEMTPLVVAGINPVFIVRACREPFGFELRVERLLDSRRSLEE